VSGLEAQYGDRIEFVTLDWDDKSLNPIRERYGITGRTQYVLVDENDAVIQRWYGPLAMNNVTSVIDEWLAANS